jgi:tRNA(Ile2) C34 agmatinyltransferase TiaS
LHARCIKAVIEGELEPVYFQGKIVGHTRKFDSRLAIELLRAHMPGTFKMRGAKVNINTSTPAPLSSGISEKELQELLEMRERSLASMREGSGASGERLSRDRGG